MENVNRTSLTRATAAAAAAATVSTAIIKGKVGRLYQCGIVVAQSL